MHNYKCRWLKTHARQRRKQLVKAFPTAFDVSSVDPSAGGQGSIPVRCVRFKVDKLAQSQIFSPKTASQALDMASNVSSYDSTGGRCSIPVQSMCDSWSTNWHRDKCFAAVLRLPSTDHLISSCDWQWSQSKPRLQGGLVQWQDNEKGTRCQTSTGNNAVAMVLLSTTRSSLWWTAFTPKASKKYPHRSVRPSIAGTFLEED